ncbi:MAG: L,D-transpeptidase family protein [Planctomycetes bacterium]|nr:L,D-transpeptidase family protein [Planctomycetota bacterium]NUQ35112.1 L,D-transpeptidase family protein [Planctomycetaceae bacterium]
MASNRKSRRDGRSKAGIMIVAGVAAIAVAGVAVYIFSGDDDGTPTEAERLIGADAVLQQAALQSAKSGDSPGVSIAQYESMGSDIRKTLSGKQGQERYGALVGGYRRMAAELEKPLPTGVREKLLPLFHELTGELFFSNIRNEFSIEYVVKPGDSIGEIAKRFKVTEELLCDWNNLDWNQRHKIRANQSFKIVKGEPRLVVDKSDFCLSFYFGDNLARQFIVAHGRGNNTPEGVSKVNGKTVDPDKAPYAGAQQQEMAERWIGFAAFGSRTGIGIHGTKYEESIPGETSLGCIRMFNRDVVELYRWVPHGAVIEIKA